MAINIEQIEDKLNQLVKNISKETFIYELLRAYGGSESTLSLLKKGKRNLSKNENQIILKKKLFFESTSSKELRSVFDQLQKAEGTYRHDPRFLIVTDFKTLLAIDTQSKEKLDIEIRTLNENYKFFEPLSPGMEKKREKDEYHADRKAAEKMAKLYDQLLKDNKISTDKERHNLNIFFSRILFCFFAEDTGLFRERALTNLISDYTNPDGRDLDSHLIKLFKVLNIEKKNRKGTPKYLKDFPFVNGELFENSDCIPKFSCFSRKLIIECGDVIWSEINLDIFGSIMQAVVSQDHRGHMGMHYTSLENINRVIKPLFLDDLWQAFEKAKDNADKLNQLLARLKRLRIFDPACGSGNFLVIAYKEICELDRSIIQRLNAFNPKKRILLSELSLNQFYGIEIDDFAHEVAILSLWLAQLQMNRLFEKQFGKAKASLPLKDRGNIVCGNANWLNWEMICPKDKDAEIYILGNPPYIGSKKQSSNQKLEMSDIFKDSKAYKNLDYIACWFMKASNYIRKTTGKFAFVSTKSLTQGDQVSLFWPIILSNKQEIFFAHTAFKWENDAKNNAAVSCIIIGISEKSNHKKWLTTKNRRMCVNNISPYLTERSNIVISRRMKPLSNIPEMSSGNMPLEGGFLKITRDEKEKIVSSYPQAKKLIKPLMGGDEFMSGSERWCIWIDDNQLHDALLIPFVKNRVDKVREFRKKGGEVAKTLVSKSHQFRYRHLAKTGFIIIPRTSSELREYLPCGYFSSEYIALDTVQVIYDPEIFIIGILSSKMHLAWVRAVAGRLETKLTYSAVLCYNTFPVPSLSDHQKEVIKSHAFSVIEERAKHSEKTMAELYDPDKMPDGLQEAHHHLDLAVERCYRSKPFTSDEERLEYLFKLYEEMIARENAGLSTVNDSQITKRKKRVASNEEVISKEKAVGNAVNDLSLRKGRKRA